MLSEQDLLFGRIMLKKRLVTEKELQECLHIQLEAARSGRDIRLGRIMIQLGYVTQEQIKEILKEQEKLQREFLSGGDLEQGEIIEGCKILKKIATGGMGTIYLANLMALNRPVALKAFNVGMFSEEETAKRVLREGRALAKLDHENIVKIYNITKLGKRYFLVLEYIEGETLEEVLKRKKVFGFSEAIDIIIQAARALDFAHQNNIIHRDVKPGNIMLVKGRHVKLMDFGLAKNIEDTMGLTASGTVAGTPHFMSPEQGKGEKIDPRSDIYSLGVVFYLMLTGRFPYDAPTPIAIIMKHIEGKLIDPRTYRADLPASLAKVIMKMLFPDKDSRYQSAQELIDTLEGLKKEMLKRKKKKGLFEQFLGLFKRQRHFY
jgi:serine/threonine-protein kinase